MVTACFCGLLSYLFLVNFFRIKKNRYGTRSISSCQYVFVIIILILFGLYGIQLGDYPHYVEIVETVYSRSGGSYDIEGRWLSHMEPQYNYLAIFVEGNHDLWRGVLMLIQYLGFGYLFKKLDLGNYEAFFIMSVFMFESICAGRVSWGLVYFWFGLYLYLETKEFKYLIFVLISLAAHTSMITLFVLLPILNFKLSKTTLFMSLIFFPIAIYLVQFHLHDYLSFDNSENNLLEYKLENYTENEEHTGKNIMGGSGMAYIAFLLYRPPLYILSIMYIKALLKKRIIVNDSESKFAIFWYVLFIFTLLTAIVDLGSASFYQRFTNMLYVPCFLLIYKSHREYFIRKKWFRFSMISLWMSFCFEYIKSIYYYNLHGV